MNFLPNETLFNIAILVFLVILILAFAGLLISVYGFLSKWLRLLQQQDISGSDKIKQDAYNEAARILDDARAKSMGIVSEATHRAQTSISAIEKLSSESKSLLSTELDELAKAQAGALKTSSLELLESYKTALTKQQEESIQSLEEASGAVEKELLQEVDEFKETLKEETADIHAKVEEKVLAEYAKVEQELDSYKTRRTKEIDETIYDILQDVSKRVLGEALSMEDHQDLVLQALEEAKQKNVFSSDK